MSTATTKNSIPVSFAQKRGVADVAGCARSPSPGRPRSLRGGCALVAIVGLVFAAGNASAKPTANEIVAIDASDSGGATSVVVRGSSTPTFTVYKLDRPARVVVDIAGATLASELRAGEDKAVWATNTWAVSQVSAHAMSQSRGDVVRVVVALARAGSYKVRARGNDVVVRVTPREAAPVTAKGADTSRELEAATQALARAEAELAAARAEAKKIESGASARDREARERVARAERLMKQVEARARSAAADKADAEKLAALAAKRQQSARDAEKRAAARRAEANEAAARARESRELAKRASAADTAELEAKAEAAARAADARRERAEKAARLADARRKQAEEAASKAEERRAGAAKAVARAEKERAAADASRRDALAARETAEARRADAEAAAREAAARAQELEKVAAAAERRATEARSLREREEKALRAAAKARGRAQQQRDAAERARASLDREVAKLRAAEKRAVAGRREARAAADEAAAAERRDADATELARLRAEARRLADAGRRAEADLSAQKKALAASRAASKKLASERDRAAGELASLQDAAARARSARKAEEKKLAALSAKRAAAEAALARAETSRDKAKKTRRKSSRVRDVDLVQGADADRVVIALSSPAKPVVIKNRGNEAILEISGAAIDDEDERTLDTSAFPGPVRSVSSYRDPERPGVVRVVVGLDRPTKAVLERVGNTYYWDFQRRSRRAAVAAKSPPPSSRSRARSAAYPTTAVAGYGAASTPITQQSVSQLSRRQKTYRGKRIDLDYKDADIHNLMRLLADVGNVNIVVPDDIKATVTIRLRRVPWDQALDVILASKGLGYKLEGPGLYRIATQKELQEEFERKLAQAKARAEAEAPEAEVFNLNYVKADQISSQLEPLLSSKGRIEVEPRTNALIINDLAANRRRIVDLLTRLDTQTPQIQIEARIVEARTSYSRELGIQWGGNMNASAAGGNATGLIFPSSVGIAGGATDNATPTGGVSATPSDFAVNLPASVGTGQGGAIGLSLGSIGGNFNLNLRLSAAEDTGTVRIISAPKITTSNNVEAEIKSGISIPISVTSANGVNTQFVQADLALQVKPNVSLRDCAVSMEILVTKNEADFVNTGARGDPSILTKEASTTILVNDGETSVIGGIYTRNTGLSYSKVPFFADIPVLGWLFKSRSENDERSEVLVFITPKITNRDALPCQ